jgi:hypothetical protein
MVCSDADQFWRNDKSCGLQDTDFGSGGVLLIPDQELSGSRLGLLGVSGEKEGGIWFTNRANPGGYNSTACGNSCSCMQAGGNNVQTYWINGGWNLGPVIHTSPAYWETDFASHPAQNYIYVGPYGSQLTQYPLCGLSSDTVPICNRSVPVGSTAGPTPVKFPWGVTPTISATTGETAPDAIVWALSVEDTSSPANPESTVPGGTSTRSTQSQWMSCTPAAPAPNAMGSPQRRNSPCQPSQTGTYMSPQNSLRVMGHPARTTARARSTSLALTPSRAPNRGLRRDLHGEPMEWTTPQFEKISLNCEINSYASAEM